MFNTSEPTSVKLCLVQEACELLCLVFQWTVSMSTWPSDQFNDVGRWINFQNKGGIRAKLKSRLLVFFFFWIIKVIILQLSICSLKILRVTESNPIVLKSWLLTKNPVKKNILSFVWHPKISTLIILHGIT